MAKTFEVIGLAGNLAVIGVMVMEVDKMADEVTDMEVDKVTDMKILIEDLTDSGDW